MAYMMTLLKERKYFLYAAGAFLFVFLFPFPSGGNKFFWKHVFDAGHFSLFFALTIGLFFLLASRTKNGNRILRSLLLSVAIAVAIEIIQPLTGRSGSFIDIFNGSLGSLSASYGLAVFKRLGFFSATLRCLPVSILAQAVVLLPSFEAWTALQWRDQLFPQLGVFEQEQSLQFWRSMNSKNNPTPAKRRLVRLEAEELTTALWIETFGNTWSGVYYDGGAQDWSSYSSLVVQTYNPQQEEIELSIRIDDTGDCTKYADRYNRSFLIKPGLHHNRFSLDEIRKGPKSRELDLSEIRFLYLFRDKKAPTSTFALQSVYLE